MKRIVLFGIVILILSVSTGCQTTARQDGALLGGALGAGLGAIIGHQSGHQGEGALIGAAAGALTGAIIGDSVGKPPRQTQRVVIVPPRQSQPQRGHYETRIVVSPSGETFEERVWVPHR